MPKTIYLIRHAETDHNKNGIAQGWLDTPLNQEGLKQAKKLSERFKNLHLDAVFSSSQTRAVQTATPLANVKKLELLKTSDIRERHMGVFEGETWETIRQKYPHYLEKLNIGDQYPDWNDFGGESFRQVTDRVKKFIAHIKTNHKDQNIAIITHGGTKRNLLLHLGFPEEAKTTQIGNTSITTIYKQHSNYHLKSLNDTSHLL